LSAPQVRFTAESGVDLLIGGRRITLAAGQSHTVTVADDTEIALPGVGSLSVVPGDDTHARLVAAPAGRSPGRPGVADLAEARRLDATRRELLSQRDHLTGTLTGLLGGDSAAALRDRLETLRAELTDGDPVDPTAVRSRPRPPKPRGAWRPRPTRHNENWWLPLPSRIPRDVWRQRLCGEGSRRAA
jgi:hypothetical protein